MTRRILALAAAPGQAASP